jgi:MFS transporter, DHA1 family, multidrug resistance protein
MTTPQTTPAPPAGRRVLALAFLLSAVSALGPLSIDLYLPAVPTMGEQLHASAGKIQMTIAVYMFGNGVGQLLIGPLSDRLGRRWPAIIGLMVYVAASLGCAFAVTGDQMIAFRLLQSLGVCAGQVVARAIIADLFEPREMARFSSLLSMITLVAPMVGPLIGGFIFTLFGWRPVFWVLAGYGVMVLAMVALRLPETRSREAQVSARGESALGAYAAVARNWPLMQMALAASFGFCGLAVYISSAPHMLIDHFNVPPAQFGVYFASNAVGLWFGSLTNRRLLRRYEPQQVLRGACLLYFFFSLCFVVGTSVPGAGKWGALVPLFFVISTFPMVMANTTALAQGYDRERGGSVAAMLGALSAVTGFVAVGAAAVFGDGTPRTTAVVMACGSALCAALFLGGRRVRSKC